MNKQTGRQYFLFRLSQPLAEATCGTKGKSIPYRQWLMLFLSIYHKYHFYYSQFLRIPHHFLSISLLKVIYRTVSTHVSFTWSKQFCFSPVKLVSYHDIVRKYFREYSICAYVSFIGFQPKVMSVRALYNNRPFICHNLFFRGLSKLLKTKPTSKGFK